MAKGLFMITGQLGDAVWILILCTFSICVRSRKMRFSIPFSIGLFVLLVLAALHSRPLWSSSEHASHPATTAQLTRILKVPATYYSTGLEIRDNITAMALDSDKRIWLTSATNGPYLYDPLTNEMDNLLDPDTIYGMAPDRSGVWVLTSTGAHLYQSTGRSRNFTFPNGAIPLAGALMTDGTLLFATNLGVYLANSDARALTPLPFARPLTQAIAVRPSGSILLSPRRLWRLSKNDVKEVPLCSPGADLTAATQAGNSLFVGTGGQGIVVQNTTGCRRVMFARGSLNNIQPGAVANHHGIPCFGAADGSVIFFKHNKWERMKLSAYPVTSLASDGTTLYVWTDGRLLAVTL